MTGDLATGGLMPLQVKNKSLLAKDIYSFELSRADGSDLPEFTAGSHIAVETPGGAMRHYSLSNDPQETHRYVLGIKVERNGRGGSLAMVDKVDEGDTVMVSPPMNEFELLPAPAYILVAGGIGITPIMSMARQLSRIGEVPFKIIYCTRNPEMTAFADELVKPAFDGKITTHHDQGDPAQAFDFWDTFATPGKAHVYCCGPTPLMEEIRGVTGQWPPSAIHFEDFGANKEQSRNDDKPFVVENSRTGKSYEIAPDQTIIEALRAAGEKPPTSCESGTCGTCKTSLIDGEADHRDLVLMGEEKSDYIMICVSRALDDKLVLSW